MNLKQFNFNYPSVQSISATPYNLSDQDCQYLKDNLKKASEIASELLAILIMMRGESYTMNHVHFDSEYAAMKSRAAFSGIFGNEALKEKMNAKYGYEKVTMDDFLEMAKAAYKSFISVIPRGFEGIFFNKDIKDIKDNKSIEWKKKGKVAEGESKVDEVVSTRIRYFYDFLRESGLLPLKTSGRNSGMTFGILSSVHSKLKSFEEIQIEYIKNKASRDAKFEKFLEINSQYASMIGELVESNVKFDKDNYSRLISNWLDKEIVSPNGDKVSVRGIRSFLCGLPLNYVFSEADNAKFGYNYKFLEVLFKYSELWRVEDAIGLESNVKAVEEILSFSKENVNISSFDNGRYVRLFFGINFTKFSLVNKNGRFFLTANNVGFENRKIVFEIKKSVFFGENTEISPCESKDGVCVKSEKDTGQYLITYSGDLNGRTKYTACINEPFLRYDTEKQKFYFDIPLTGHHMSGDEISDQFIKANKQRNKDILTYFASASNPELPYGEMETTTGKKISLVEDIFKDDKEIVFAGVDFGISNVFTISLCKATRDGKFTEIGAINSSDFKRRDTSHYYDMRDRLDVFRQKQELVRALYAVTNSHLSGVDVSQGVTPRGGTFKAWSLRENYCNLFSSPELKEYFSGDWFGKYLSYLDSLKNTEYYKVMSAKSPENGMNHIKKILKFGYLDPNWNNMDLKEKAKVVEIQNATQKWIVHAMMKELRSDISWLRSRYQEAKDKVAYCQSKNYPDLITFLKKVVVQDYISLVRRMYNYGELPSVDDSDFGAKGNKNLCKGLYAYLDGLAQQCVRIAENMVNAARFGAPGLKIIFIEDMDSRASVYETTKDNRLKSLWAFGEIRKYLVNKAGKHNICVVPVAPDMTSQVYVGSDGGYHLGYRPYSGKKSAHVNIEGRKYKLDSRTLFVDIDGKIKCFDCDENAAKNIAMRGWMRCEDFRTFSAKLVGEKDPADILVITHEKAKGKSNDEDSSDDKKTSYKRLGAGLSSCLPSQISKNKIIDGKRVFGNCHFVFKRDGGSYQFVETKDLKHKFNNSEKYAKVFFGKSGVRLVEEIRQDTRIKVESSSDK